MLTTYKDLVSGNFFDLIFWKNLPDWIIPVSLTIAFYEKSPTPLVILIGLYLRAYPDFLPPRFSSTQISNSILIIMLFLALAEFWAWVPVLIGLEVFKFGLRHLSRTGHYPGLLDPGIQTLYRMLYSAAINRLTFSQFLDKIKEYLQNPTGNPYSPEEATEIQNALTNLDSTLIYWQVPIPTVFISDRVVFLHNYIPRILSQKYSVQSLQGTCSICSSEQTKWIQLSCGTDQEKHKFCVECFARWFGAHQECPLCRVPIT